MFFRSGHSAHGAGHKLVVRAALGAFRRRLAAGGFQPLAGGVDAGEVLYLALARPFRAVRVVVAGHGQAPFGDCSLVSTVFPPSGHPSMSSGPLRRRVRDRGSGCTRRRGSRPRCW